MENLRVFTLMAGLTALLVVIGGAVSGTNGMVLFFGFAAALNFGMYWWSDRAVLRMYKAQIVTEAEAPELFRMIDRLRQVADLPMPTVPITPAQGAVAMVGSVIRWGAIFGGLGRDEDDNVIGMLCMAIVAQLAIVNPLAGNRGFGFLKLFSTHPSTAERVARLEALQREIAA